MSLGDFRNTLYSYPFSNDNEDRADLIGDVFLFLDLNGNPAVLPAGRSQFSVTNPVAGITPNLYKL